MRKQFALVFIFSSLAPALSRGAGCDNPQTVADLLACARLRHPDALRAAAALDGVDGFRAAAAQRPNPDLDAQSSVADIDAGSLVRTEASLKHTFELGGKRERRLRRADAQQRLAIAEARRRQDDVAIQTVLNVFRLRHNLAERETVEEALGTFEKITRQYRSRRKLPPEQEVSAGVFDFAKADYSLRLSGLREEHRRLKAFFDLATALPLERVETMVNAWQPRWPARADMDSSARNGAAWALLEAQQALAGADVELTQSEATPNLALGPFVEVDSGAGESITGWGGAVSMALPLYQRNAGSIQLARRDQRQAEVNAVQTQRELEALRAAQLDIYEMALASLRSAPLKKDMTAAHHDIERLFERGLVSAALIIEAHRQMTDVITATNEQEIRAAEALWTLHALDGRIPKESL